MPRQITKVEAIPARVPFRAAFVIGMCSIVAVTVILVAWRTGQLHSQLGL